MILSVTRIVDSEEKVIIPSGETVFRANDRLTLYGRNAACACLSQRPKGESGKEIHQKRVNINEKIKEIEETTGEAVENI